MSSRSFEGGSGRSEEALDMIRLDRFRPALRKCINDRSRKRLIAMGWCRSEATHCVTHPPARGVSVAGLRERAAPYNACSRPVKISSRGVPRAAAGPFGCSVELRGGDVWELREGPVDLREGAGL